MEPLATREDVATMLRRPLTPTEEPYVDKALTRLSAEFRLRAGRDLTPGRHEVTINVYGQEAWVPAPPIGAIYSVRDMRGESIPYILRGRNRIVVGPLMMQIVVDYDHDADGVPDLARITVAEAVARVLRTPEAVVAGATQVTETAGQLSQSTTFAGWAAGGQAMLSRADIAMAESFRVKPPRIHVQRSY